MCVSVCVYIYIYIYIKASYPRVACTSAHMFVCVLSLVSRAKCMILGLFGETRNKYIISGSSANVRGG